MLITLQPDFYYRSRLSSSSVCVIIIITAALAATADGRISSFGPKAAIQLLLHNSVLLHCISALLLPPHDL